MAKQKQQGTPVPKTPPVGMMLIHITTIHPHNPADPESKVDQGSTDPLAFEIHPNVKAHELPQGMLAYVRKLLEGSVAHCRTYKPQILPLAKDEPVKTSKPANDDVLVTGAAPDETVATARETFTVPDGGPTEVEQGICARCGWREMECGCEEGYLAPGAA